MAAAWIGGLAIVQTGATIHFAQRADGLAARAGALAGRGLFAPPAGAAVEALQSPVAWVLAGLPYTLTLGMSAVVLAHLCADLFARWHRTRALPAVLAAALTAGLAWRFGAPALWMVLGAAVIGPYCILLPVGMAARVPLGAVATRWAAVALLLAPAAWAVESWHLAQVRTALLALPGGAAVVNGYYRQAVFAADPIKRPEQRFYLGYQGTEVLAHPWRCLREPFLLLPVEGWAGADLTGADLTGADPAGAGLSGADLVLVPATRAGDAPRLRRAAGGPAIALDLAVARPAVLEPESRRALRALLVWAVPLGIPLAVAYGLVNAIAAGGRGRLAVGGSLAIGLALTAALAIGESAGGTAAPVSDGTARQRMQAASVGLTSAEALARLAHADRLLPVRARALAQRVSRAEDAGAQVSEVAAAATWYEQWYGYGALLRRGWHPDPRCRG